MLLDKHGDNQEDDGYTDKIEFRLQAPFFVVMMMAATSMMLMVLMMFMFMFSLFVTVFEHPGAGVRLNADQRGKA